MSDGQQATGDPPTGSATTGRLAAYVASALKYWELRRIIYNVALAAVIAHFLSTAVLGVQ